VGSSGVPHGLSPQFLNPLREGLAKRIDLSRQILHEASHRLSEHSGLARSLQLGQPSRVDITRLDLHYPDPRAQGMPGGNVLAGTKR
jgi:hypothetical protein